MSDYGNTTTTAGISGGTLLFFIFLVLKLTETISWSWWYVTMPLWLGWVVLFAVLLLVAVIAGIYFAVTTIVNYKKKSK
jgi:hypothetical protein